MILEVYSVLDKAVGAFLPPMFMRSRGEALRAFSQAVNSSEHMFNKNAGDYTMFCLGKWDDQSGMFAPSDPERILGALELIERSPPA